MEEIKIRVSYNLETITKDISVSVDVLKLIKENKIDSNRCLTDDVYDDVWNNIYGNKALEINGVVVDEIIDVDFIENINYNDEFKEFIPQIEKPITCCDKQPENHIYCSKCGSRLWK